MLGGGLKRCGLCVGGKRKRFEISIYAKQIRYILIQMAFRHTEREVFLRGL